MRLKTTMGGFCLKVDDVFIDPDNIEWYQAGKVSHDAMAAHALLQAMVEADEQDGNVSGQWGTCIEQIRLRAAEILAGWLGEEAG